MLLKSQWVLALCAFVLIMKDINADYEKKNATSIINVTNTRNPNIDNNFNQSEPTNKSDGQKTVTLSSTEGSIKSLNLKKGKNGTSTAKPTPVVTEAATYRLRRQEDGTTCILIKVDAIIMFVYPTKSNENDESDKFVPNNVKIDGSCTIEDYVVISLEWEFYKLTFEFSMTPGREKWYVNKIKFEFSTDDSRLFHRIIYEDTQMEATTKEGDLLFPTPVGRSFTCHRELSVNLIEPSYPNMKVNLLLRKLTMQPFIFKNDEFGPTYKCHAPGARDFHDETVPFIFGSLLAVASLGTIAGYAAYRYFKVNRVQYDPMD